MTTMYIKKRNLGKNTQLAGMDTHQMNVIIPGVYFRNVYHRFVSFD